MNKKLTSYLLVLFLLITCIIPNIVVSRAEESIFGVEEKNPEAINLLNGANDEQKKTKNEDESIKQATNDNNVQSVEENNGIDNSKEDLKLKALQNTYVDQNIRVGNEGFDSLQEAVDSIESEGIIVLCNSFWEYDTVTIPNGKKITITDDGEERTITKGGFDNINPLFLVEQGAEFTIEGTTDSNLIIMQDQWLGLIKDVGKTGDFVHNKGTFNLKKGTLKCGAYNSNARILGVVYVDDMSVFNMSGGIIEGMKSYAEFVSPVLVYAGGRFNMSGGVIQDNEVNPDSNASWGGGVLLFSWNDDPLAFMRMTGGVIRNNKAYHGGGVFLTGNTKFIMDDGLIENNIATEQGGGVSVGAWSGVEKPYNTFFTMNGGTIKNNTAANGGGIFVNSDGVELVAGHIIGNNAIASEQNVWSGHGGGIYVSMIPRVLKISKTLVTNNTAKGNKEDNTDGMGGGLWACPTGTLEFKVTNGIAVFDNKAIGNKSAGDDVVKVNNFLGVYNGTITLPNRLLGGGKVEWYKDGEIIQDQVGIVDTSVPRYDAQNPGQKLNIKNSKDAWAVKAVVSEEAKKRAREEAKLFIEGNTAIHGGGIGTNGDVSMPNINIPDWELKVKKLWDKEIKDEDKKEVEIFLKINNIVLDSVKLNSDNNWMNKFEELPDPNSLIGKKIEVIEGERFIENGRETIKETSKWEVSYEEILNKNYEIDIEIKNKPKDTPPPIIPPYEPEDPPTIDIKVEKEWVDDGGRRIDSYVEKIEVELYRDGITTGRIIELNRDNNWKGVFRNLDVYRDKYSRNYQYTIREVGEKKSIIKFAEEEFKVYYSGSMRDGFKITNEKTPPTPYEPPLTKIRVTKKWKDSEGNFIETVKQKIKVELYENGIPTGIIAELNNDNNWIANFENLLLFENENGPYKQYSVKEIGEEKGRIIVDEEEYEVSYKGSMEYGFEITNTKKPEEPEEPIETPETPPVPEKPQPPQKPTLPKTGDGINRSTYMIAIAVIGMIMILIGIRKRRYEERRFRR